MDLRQLEYFLAVADELNFSRAARNAHVVQSALSASVAKLERELGVALFDRTRQQIRLTPAGEVFRDSALRVINTARQARDSIGDYRDQLSGTIEFGSIVSFGTLPVPRILGEFHRAHPHVRIKMRLGQLASTSYLPSIVDGSLDLAFVTAPDQFPAKVEMRFLTAEPLLFVCRPEHRLAKRRSINLTELSGEDLLGFPAHFGLRRVVENAFASARVIPQTPYEITTDFHLAAEMVRHGLGSVFMPLSETGRFPDLKAVPVFPSIEWSIFLAWAKHERLRPASARLAEMLLESAGCDTEILTRSTASEDAPAKPPG
ncbi:MAG: LysR family transcriptional regulator [Mycobacterium sp.]|nr:LysR family transcriptional regulator [Mycobacterium sp.]